MYIAGLDLVHSLHLTPHSLEGVVWGSVTVAWATMFNNQRRSAALAQSEGGDIKSAPKTLFGRLISLVHAVPIVVPPLSYIFVLPFNTMQQPELFTRFSLPALEFEEEVALRLAGSADVLGTAYFLCRAMAHLAKNFHYISVRKNPSVVSTGPYSVVRHPLYTSAILNQIFMGLAMWNKIPLYALAIILPALIMKIPIEEELILKDEIIGAEYALYQKKVPYKMLPYIW